jgi:hypothetical protein
MTENRQVLGRDLLAGLAGSRLVLPGRLFLGFRRDPRDENLLTPERGGHRVDRVGDTFTAEGLPRARAAGIGKIRHWRSF